MADYDLVVIGAGPGGYVAAIRASQLGMRAAIVERESVGGVCLNWGCIPSKALIRNAEVLSLIRRASEFGIQVGQIKADYALGIERTRKVIDRLKKGIGVLLKRHKIDLIHGYGKLMDSKTISVDDQRIRSQNILIATGAQPRKPLNFEIDGELVVTYRQGIFMNNVPNHIIILGGGAIGVEMAYVYNAYGARVTVVETASTILPQEDLDISKHLKRSLEQKGITILTESNIVGFEKKGATQADVVIDTPLGKQTLHTNRVLVSIGIEANTEGLGLDNVGVELENGYIKVDNRLSANAENVYAVGDVTGILPLAHVAQAQGVLVAEHLAGIKPRSLDYGAMPRAVYCEPQVASLGLTEQQALDKGLSYQVGSFPMLANGKALAMGTKEGIAKIIVDSKSGELLGAHLVGHEVTELLGELSLARILGGTNLEIGAVVNVHPSISEVVKEAALNTGGMAIHI